MSDLSTLKNAIDTVADKIDKISQEMYLIHDDVQKSIDAIVDLLAGSSRQIEKELWGNLNSTQTETLYVRDALHAIAWTLHDKANNCESPESPLSMTISATTGTGRHGTVGIAAQLR